MTKFLLLTAAGVLAATAALAEHHEMDGDKAMGPPELTGVFTGDNWVGTFMPEGYLVGVDASTGAAEIIVKYGAKDGVIWFKNLVTPREASEEGAECSKTKKGKYNYTLEGDALTFSLVEDPCPGRVGAVDGTTLTRKAMPAPAEE